MTICDINRHTEELLNEIRDINALIGLDCNIFASKTEQEENNISDYFYANDLCLSVKKHSNGYHAEIANWHSHSVCLTGLIFSNPVIMGLTELKSGTITCSATLSNGLGARYFYKALSTRKITVVFVFEYDAAVFEDEDEIYALSVEIASVSINFLTETEAELKEIYDSLKAQHALFQKQILLSNVIGNYKNFHKLTGIDQGEFYKAYVKNAKFTELFDED